VGLCSPTYLNRAAFADRGIAVALIDATSAGSVYEFDNVLAVVREVRRRDNAPVWIIGGSASTNAVAFTAASLPSDIPAGVIFMSPGRPSATVSTITRPAAVVYHTGDSTAFGSLMYNALTAAVVRDRQAITGGTNSGCGFHLFNGTEAEFVEATAGFITRHNAATGAAGALNFQALWYKAPAESESGWGVNIAHQGDVFFVTWFTYDTDGSQMWLVAPDVRKTTGNTYAGPAYRTTGPAFNAVPFGAISFVQAGQMSFAFTDAGNGTFTYTTANGESLARTITRQVFGTPPTCAAGGTPGTTTNFSDLWYRFPAESEAGWGVNIAHQGDILFVTWFTYDLNGRGMWVVGPRMERAPGTNAFTGPLFRTSGPAFNAVPWNPASVTPLPFGNATITFTEADRGTFSYNVTGLGPAVQQAKEITRQTFGTPATVCR
jgi:hypothetical protein